MIHCLSLWEPFQYSFNKFLGVYTVAIPTLSSAANRGVPHHFMSCVLDLFMHMIYFLYWTVSSLKPECVFNPSFSPQWPSQTDTHWIDTNWIKE